MKSLFLFCLTLWVLSTPYVASAQEEEGRTKLFLSGAYGMLGTTIQKDIILTQKMINQLGYANYIDGLSPYFPDYYWNKNRYTSAMPTHVNLGIELSQTSKNSNKFNGSLRIGFQYVSKNMVLNTTYGKLELLGVTITDTLVSLVTKDTVYLFYNDSIRSQTRNIAYTNELIALDASYIIRSNSARTISFLGGIGFAPGLIVNSNSIFTASDFLGSGPNNSTRTNFAYSKSNKKGVNLHFYIPLGVNFHLSKKHDFWKNIYLVSEIRPSMSIQMVSDIGTHTRFFSQNMAGIRALFN